MKKNINTLVVCIMLSISLLLTITSCKYNDIVPADYPEQSIYMTTAAAATKSPNANGLYEIANVAIPGQDFKYIINTTDNKFIVPLGITRAGADLKGEVNVGLTFNLDTIAKLKTLGRLAADIELLPTNVSKIPAVTTIADGSSSSIFSLEINLPYLISNPGKKYAIAVAISDANKRINKSLNTTVTVISTSFLFPVANFSFAADINTPRKINFSNTSLYGLTYAWDFGDGTPISSEKSPIHTYSASGTYQVKLITVGVTGDAQKSTKISSVVVN